MKRTSTDPERKRQAEGRHWQAWGPYLSERKWGTVREDYSPHGTAWEYFPHDHARSRAYRWGEDGLGGFSDHRARMCVAIALWNERDPILKERFFGLTNSEANHGEDVKELDYYLDATPTHSYLRMLYKYPQAAFPYTDLVAENHMSGCRAGRSTSSSASPWTSPRLPHVADCLGKTVCVPFMATRGNGTGRQNPEGLARPGKRLADRRHRGARRGR